MKVFIFDPLWSKLSDDNLEKRLSKCNADVTIVTDIKSLTETPQLFEGDEERILCLNPDYVGWKLAADDYLSIPSLKAILVASTGYEWVEKDLAKERNIPVCNIKNFSTESVAEWAITMMFNLARQTPKLIKDGFPLDYDADFMKYRGVQLKGKTAGIVGLGNIGSAIAERCSGLGMNVIYWSRSPLDNSYERVELSGLMASADVIFPALAKNEETLQLFDKELLSSMKKTTILVDIAHRFFDPVIVLDMIRSGRLFGYGFEAEPKDFDTYEGNVWAAPAYAWTTAESMYNSELKLVENINSACQGEFPSRVN